MRRRDFISFLGGAAATTWPRVPRAQQAGKVYRVGILQPLPRAQDGNNFDALLQGLRELGYFEGQNLVIEFRSSDGHDDRFPDLATELIRLNVDLIVTRGTPAALAAKNATKAIPIVMAAIGDPVENGVVASLARPGANVTGLSSSVTDLQAKRLELLKELVPGIARIALLTNIGNPNEQLNWKETERAAQFLGVAARLLDVRKIEDIGRAFDSASEQRTDALVVAVDGFLTRNRQLITDLAVKHRLPAIYPSREFIDPGGLASYGPSYVDLYRRAAPYVDKILKGANPSDLPVMQPTKFEFVINLRAAKAIGLTVPPILITRADEVIE